MRFIRLDNPVHFLEIITKVIENSYLCCLAQTYIHFKTIKSNTEIDFYYLETINNALTYR